MPIPVELHIKEIQGNLSQIILGLVRLHKSKQIQLKVFFDQDLQVGECIAWLIIDNKVSLFLDSDDRSRILDKYLSQHDFYLKRMLRKEDYNQHPQQLLPMGLNYILGTEGWFFMKEIVKAGKMKFFRKKLPHFFTPFSKLAGKAYMMAAVRIEDFYSPPQQRPTPKVTFYTRLFNPKKNEQLNTERIALVAGLKKAFAEQFAGGLRTDPRTMEFAPELATPPSITRRDHFVKHLSTLDIGVSNQGLEGSIGCKVAEYAMQSMAIISNDISDYYIPGNFQEGVHYLSYTTVEEAIQKTNQLIRHPEQLTAMKIANFRYANHFLMPELYLWEIIVKII